MKDVIVVVMKNGSQIHFKVTSPTVLKPEDAKKLQAEKGYLPGGYGFYDFDFRPRSDGFEYTWNCHSSCD